MRVPEQQKSKDVDETGREMKPGFRIVFVLFGPRSM